MESTVINADRWPMQKTQSVHPAVCAALDDKASDEEALQSNPTRSDEWRVVSTAHSNLRGSETEDAMEQTPGTGFEALRTQTLTVERKGLRNQDLHGNGKVVFPACPSETVFPFEALAMRVTGEPTALTKTCVAEFGSIKAEKRPLPRSNPPGALVPRNTLTRAATLTFRSIPLEAKKPRRWEPAAVRRPPRGSGDR